MLPEGSLLEGTYEVISKLNEGGMGSIYKVRHRHLDEVRVLKVLRPDLVESDEMRQRFAQEAQFVTKLKHPNIGAIFDFVLDVDGMAYIVMEFVDGSNLSQILAAQGPPSLALSLEIVTQTLSALSYLHRKKIVHRDISAANIMLSVHEDGDLQIKLIDLGLAKHLESVKGMTSTGVIMGNLYYASPEQLGGVQDGEKLDARSDIYSLGVVLYELATGYRPFTGQTPMEMVTGHCLKPPLSFDVSDPTHRVPDDIRAVILKALQKKPSDRFTGADDFAEALKPIRKRYEEPLDLVFLRNLVRSARPKSSPTNPALGRRGSGPRSSSTPRSTPRQALEPNAPTQRVDTTAPTTNPSGTVTSPSIVAPSRDATTPPVPPPSNPFKTAVFIAIPVGVLAIVGTLFYIRSLDSGKGEEKPVIATPVPVAPTVAVPTPVPTDAGPKPTEPPRVDEAAVRAESARDYASKARARADKTNAAQLAAALYEKAQKKEREAVAHLTAGRAKEAFQAFEQSSEAYGVAETAAYETARQRAIAAALPTPAPPPTAAPRPTEPPPTSTPVPRATEPPRPTAVPEKKVTDEDRIRETLTRFQRAMSDLNVDQLARVRPSIDRSKMEAAFKNLNAMSLQLDIRKVEVEGDRATVRANESQRVAPRVGSEQKNDRAVTIKLQKSGSDWVIVSID